MYTVTDDSIILQAGTTPLMCAAQNGHEDVISILLEHKAKVEIKRKVNRVFCTYVIFEYLHFWLDIYLLLQHVPYIYSVPHTSICTQSAANACAV